MYGKIFTSDNDKVVEAFAVKDRKFVYVGDREGVETFVKEWHTQVVNHTDRGIVIPSCYEEHAHYMMAEGMKIIIVVR